VYRQECTDGSAPDEALAEITVTGSRIARSDASTVGPVTTLTLQDIEAAAPLSVGELLQELPGAGVSLNSNGTQGTSFGVSAVNLRYLGSSEGSGNRVLVLVDGNRWVNAAGGRGFRDFVDLNTIPLGMVESIGIPATLNGGVCADLTAAMVADGLSELRERFSAQLIESPLQRAGVLGTPVAMLGIAPFIASLAVVQEGEELHHQQVGATALCDAERMMPYSAPVVGAVMAGPIKREAASNLLKQTHAVVHHWVSCPERDQ